MPELLSIANGEDKSSDLANCIRNHYKHLKKWAKRTSTNCFRLYDGHIHHYPLAIDYYAGRFCVYYYAKSGDQELPEGSLVTSLENALKIVFGISSNQIFWKTRAKTKATRQYEKIDETKQFFEVWEFGVKFKINLVDYLDTGLFLDHRETRQFIAKQSKGKNVLNLFAYTCSFSVHAAVKGALFTKSVDMSNTYTQWGAENFLINQISLENHEIIREDCLKFMTHEPTQSILYDIIVIDPPTISRSKKMDQLFDIQVDYLFLIQQSLKLLSNEGVILFSTNSRRFKFDLECFDNCQINEITEKTIPLDFAGSKIHRTWIIKKL